MKTTSKFIIYILILSQLLVGTITFICIVFSDNSDNTELVVSDTELESESEKEKEVEDKITDNQIVFNLDSKVFNYAILSIDKQIISNHLEINLPPPESTITTS